jgi:hypothetical protein
LIADQTICLASNYPEAFMARAVIDMVTLDLRLEEELAKYANLKDFKVVLYRQDPDETGCNWNARIERVGGRHLNDCSWWDVVPQLRERFNLR